MKTFIGMILILCLTTEQTSAQSAPPVKAIQLSPAEFQKLVVQSQAKTGKIDVKVQDNRRPEDMALEEAQKRKEEEEKEKTVKKSSSGGGADFGLNAWFSGFHGDDELALLVFAVVGAVIVFAWIPYFPVLAYKALKDDKNKTVDIVGLSILGAGDSQRGQYRYGTLTSGRYSLYLQERDEEEPGNLLGFSADIGHYKFKEKNTDTGESDVVEGAYWLLGPSIIFGYEDPVFGKLDLLGGTSFGSDLGLVTKADATINFRLGDSGFIIGAGIGALYFENKGSRGIASDINKLSLSLIGGISYDFE